MTRHRISTTTTSLLALMAAATVSSSAEAQYGRAPAQNPYSAVQNLFGAPRAQTPYGAQAQNVYVYPSRGQSQEQVARDRYEC